MFSAGVLEMLEVQVERLIGPQILFLRFQKNLQPLYKNVYSKLV